MHAKGLFVSVDECVLIYCAKILRVLFLNFLIVLFLAIQLTPILCCAMYFLLVSVRLALINGSGCASRPMLASSRSFGMGYFTDGKGIFMLHSIQS